MQSDLDFTLRGASALGAALTAVQAHLRDRVLARSAVRRSPNSSRSPTCARPPPRRPGRWRRVSSPRTGRSPTSPAPG
ncbi:hypothetical protein V2I01_15170 [Micromonospora sp. BRA006-A]|nr:hypothetical protein [Micromonospora sp. BRA006-A]